MGLNKRVFTMFMTGVVVAGNMPQMAMGAYATEVADDKVELEVSEASDAVTTVSDETEHLLDEAQIVSEEKLDVDVEDEAVVVEVEEEVFELDLEEEATSVEEDLKEISLTNLEEEVEGVSIVDAVETLGVDTAITVSVKVLGDKKHGNNGAIHGLATDGLVVWAEDSKVKANSSDSVWDVLEGFLEKHNIKVTADGNNSYGSIYISALTYKGVKLAEFDNGSLSGWMYTVNGKHPNVGVDAKTVKNGDEIVLHYTDDYSYEEGGVNFGKPVKGDSNKDDSDKNDTPSDKEDSSTGDDSNKDDSNTEQAPIVVPEADYSISYQSNFSYTGSAIKPSVIVKDGNRQLAEGVDYSISYKNNTNVGTAQIIIKGKNGHSLNETKTFSIDKIDLSDASIYAASIYSEKAVKNPVPVITRNGKKLSNGKDFTLSYENGGSYSASGKITVTGKGNYTGSMTVAVTIVDGKNASLMSKAKVSNVKNFTYGEAHKQNPTVKFGKEILEAGKDYEISYLNTEQAGTATMVLTGKGKYVGEKQVSFKILGTDIKKVNVSGLEKAVNYTGSEIKANYTLTFAGATLKEGTDYIVSYGKNVSAGKASIIFTGINGYSGTLKKSFTIGKCDLSKASIAIVGGNTQAYVNGGVKPKVYVSFNGMVLREKADYTVAYKNNKKVGTATMTITGKGSFSGKVVKTFKIK